MLLGHCAYCLCIVHPACTTVNLKSCWDKPQAVARIQQERHPMLLGHCAYCLCTVHPACMTRCFTYCRGTSEECSLWSSRVQIVASAQPQN